ncbi:MAG TPA: hypothetical protein VI010_01745 [Xanthobacteraceae bacterium]|jgi:hypothetical protein
MRKSLTAFAAAGTLAVATIATPTTADARWGWGPALGGLAVGAIIGSALARPAYGYYGYPAYSYGYAPAYYGYAYSPGYYGYYAPRPYYSCWRGRYRYRVC